MSQAGPGAGAGEAAGPLVLAVVGLGCIGGSIAMRARSLGVRVVGFDLPGPLEVALALGMIDEALPSFEAAADSAVLVIATPPEATCRYLERLAGVANATGVVIDVASVKVPIARAGAALANFVPTHPIAGSERSGAGAASPSLFEGRSWAVVPQGSADAQSRARAFIAAMGATALVIDADVHDRTVAMTSHLPQVVSVALAAALDGPLADPVVLALSGSGLASMTRLGASSWPLWRDVLSANRESVAQDVRSLSALLGDVAAALERDDVASLEKTFAAAARAAGRLAPRTSHAPAAIAAREPAAQPARS